MQRKVNLINLKKGAMLKENSRYQRCQLNQFYKKFRKNPRHILKISIKTYGIAFDFVLFGKKFDKKPQRKRTVV